MGRMRRFVLMVVWCVLNEGSVLGKWMVGSEDGFTDGTSDHHLKWNKKERMLSLPHFLFLTSSLFFPLSPIISIPDKKTVHHFFFFFCSSSSDMRMIQELIQVKRSHTTLIVPLLLSFSLFVSVLQLFLFVFRSWCWADSHSASELHHHHHEKEQKRRSSEKYIIWWWCRWWCSCCYLMLFTFLVSLVSSSGGDQFRQWRWGWWWRLSISSHILSLSLSHSTSMRREPVFFLALKPHATGGGWQMMRRVADAVVAW